MELIFVCDIRQEHLLPVSLQIESQFSQQLSLNNPLFLFDFSHFLKIEA